jgi:hypothetical protein
VDYDNSTVTSFLSEERSKDIMTREQREKDKKSIIETFINDHLQKRPDATYKVEQYTCEYPPMKQMDARYINQLWILSPDKIDSIRSLMMEAQIEAHIEDHFLVNVKDESTTSGLFVVYSYDDNFSDLKSWNSGYSREQWTHKSTHDRHRLIGWTTDYIKAKETVDYLEKTFSGLNFIIRNVLDKKLNPAEKWQLGVTDGTPQYPFIDTISTI